MSAQSNYVAVAPMNGVKTEVHVRDIRTAAPVDRLPGKPRREEVPAARPGCLCPHSPAPRTAGYLRGTVSPYSGETAAVHPLATDKVLGTPD